MSDLYIITGACGTGKSSILPGLKKRFPEFEVYDFDDYDMPENPTVEWAREATQYWLELVSVNITHQKKTILAGLIRPSDIREFTSNTNIKIRFCLLDVNIEERALRLKKRGASRELIDDLQESVGFPI